MRRIWTLRCSNLPVGNAPFGSEKSSIRIYANFRSAKRLGILLHNLQSVIRGVDVSVPGEVLDVDPSFLDCPKSKEWPHQ